MSEPTRFRNRIVLMTATDWRRFSEALTVAFPEARYVMEPPEAQRDRPRHHPPRVLISRDFFRIQRAAMRWGADTRMIFDDGWRPIWRKTDDAASWSYWPARHPQVAFRYSPGGVVKLLERPPQVHQTWINFYCNPAFPEHFRLAAQFYRLLAKFANDRHLADVEIPSGKVVETYTNRTSSRWVGHDARRWAMQDPSHFLEVYTSLHKGLRPLTEAAPRKKSRSRLTEAEPVLPLPSFRCYFAALLPGDLKRLSDRLAGAFPLARYYMEPTFKQMIRRTPRLLIGPSFYRIWRFARLHRSNLRMILDPEWRPIWRSLWWTREMKIWRHGPPKSPLVDFEDLSGVFLTGPENGERRGVKMGLITLRFDAEDAAQYRFADRFVEALAAVSSNSNLVEVDSKSGEATDRFAGQPAWAWIGEDVRRWALEDSKRFATIDTAGRGLRPVRPTP